MSRGGNVAAFSVVARLLVYGAMKKEIKLHAFGFNNNGILIKMILLYDHRGIVAAIASSWGITLGNGILIYSQKLVVLLSPAI